ncbi:hypothetical protein B484DRAFT_400091 [Ochromonadaceae sp. CCMP2298]|nr:hypothetical protein B484DRAFT_400091 [Ochromonadaceae sp. CCMP2298]
MSGMAAQWGWAHAAAFCLGNASLYVGSLYLIPARVRTLSRDHPTHMRYRMAAVTLSTATSLALFYLLVPVRLLGVTPLAALGLGLSRILPTLASTTLLMGIFYLGILE